MKHLPMLAWAIGSLMATAPVFAGEPSIPDSRSTASPSRIKLSGWLEAGVTGNFASPDDHQNFGRLFDDRSNEPLLNQFVLTLEQTLDPKAADRFDWGFKAQFLYGSDARYIHSVGIFDNIQHEIVQPDVVEAWLILHTPIANTAGGLDIKAGKFVTLEGAETIDPRANVFYSHSYIFNFGIPFSHTGVLTTFHPIKGLDLYAGMTRGVNTSATDNNSSAGFHGGVGVTLLDGKLTALATTHIGPENPGNNHDYRYLNTITLTWKATEKLTSITDLNYIYEESFDAKGYGIAQYFTYAINDWLTAGIRGEIWRDADGFYVAQFASNDDFIHVTRGDNTVLDPRTVGGGRTTYGALTVGVTIKPPVPKPLEGLTIRPEIRYDRSLNDTRPFNDSSDIDMLTAGIDVVFSF
jgi:hypothetical protein